MLTNGGMNDAAVEQDLGCIGNPGKHLECIVEFIVVVVSQCCDPCLDVLFVTVSAVVSERGKVHGRTCFIDMFVEPSSVARAEHKSLEQGGHDQILTATDLICRDTQHTQTTLSDTVI